MKNRYFKNKPKLMMILTAIAVLSIGVRLLFTFNYGTTALLYVGIPYLVSLLLIKIRDPGEPATWQKQFLNRTIDAFIIMFGSAVILFEGFVCVVMFMPIYLTVILIMFLINTLYERQRKKSKGTLSIHILPMLIVLSSFEGVSSELSFERNEQVSVTRIVQSNVIEIKNNLIQPMDLKKSRSWFLALFPMPDDIKAGSLTPGDVHEIHFKYYRWFFTNLHQGRMLLEMSEVDNNTIKTTFIEDTSYIANYVDLKGTEIKLDALDANRTRITLTINYNRKLDPYWYFAPIERYGISKTADFLITEVIAREDR